MVFGWSCFFRLSHLLKGEENMNWKLLGVCLLVVIVGILAYFFTPLGVWLYPYTTGITPTLTPLTTPMVNFIGSGFGIPAIAGLFSAAFGVVWKVFKDRANQIQEDFAQKVSSTKLQASNTIVTVQKEYEDKLATQVASVKTEAQTQIDTLTGKYQATIEQKDAEIQKLITERNNAELEAYRKLNPQIICRSCQTSYPASLLNCPICQTPQLKVA